MKGDESEWNFYALGRQGVRVAGSARAGKLKILSMRLLVEAGMK